MIQYRKGHTSMHQSKQRNSREGLSNLSGKSGKNERSTDYSVRSRLGISTKTVGNDTQCVTTFLKEVSLHVGTYAEVKKQEMKHRSQQMLQQSS